MYADNSFLKEMPFRLINNSKLKDIFYSTDNSNILPNFFVKDNFPFSKINNTELFFINNNNLNKRLNFDNYTGPVGVGTQYCSIEHLNSQEKKNLTNNYELTFLHVNIRGLRKNLSQLEELITSCNICPDIIGIGETKLNKNSNTDLL